MKVQIPDGSYIKQMVVNDHDVEIDFLPKKKIALLFVSINLNYWPYLKQVIADCRSNFLPQHNVDYFVWSDMPKVGSPEYNQIVSSLIPQKEFEEFVHKTGARPDGQFFSREQVKEAIDFLQSQNDIIVTETEGVQWPAPTLMRYHLFLQQEKLKDYDYIFYLDADMRVVQKISDEVLGEGLTAAPHPGYAVMPLLIPPYEPNPESEAYIPRLGRLVDEGGRQRFHPFYAAGGFQGGKAGEFIKAMEVMREKIDKDFSKNYIAIWNDESHWNRYLFDYQNQKGHITFLDVSYVYPDSLIKELYEPRIWGKTVEPKIITLTKPFTLSKQAAAEINKVTGGPPPFQCPQCKDNFSAPGHKILRVVNCPGSGKPHQMDLEKI